jgi:hypothetical protein
MIAWKNPLRAFLIPGVSFRNKGSNSMKDALYYRISGTLIQGAALFERLNRRQAETPLDPGGPQAQRGRQARPGESTDQAQALRPLPVFGLASQFGP